MPNSSSDPNANLDSQLNSLDPAVRKRAQEEQLRRQNSENSMRDRSSPDSAMRREPPLPQMYVKPEPKIGPNPNYSDSKKERLAKRPPPPKRETPFYPAPPGIINQMPMTQAESYSNRRLGIILETVSEILESNRARRKYTKTEKTLAHFDLVAKGVSEDEMPPIGARSQRIARKDRKPDFLDFNKDGNKKEPMVDAIKDMKQRKR